MRYPYTEYYKNLVKLMKYIKCTIVITLILSIGKSGNTKFYIDAAFAVHKYMKIHTGGFMTMVTVWAYVQSIKKN